jgi:hypothetical protein
MAGRFDWAVFTQSLHRRRVILPRFSTLPFKLCLLYRLPFGCRALRVSGGIVDIVFLVAIGALFAATLALVAGCAALERKK